MRLWTWIGGLFARLWTWLWRLFARREPAGADPNVRFLSEDQQHALDQILQDNWDTDCILLYGAAGTGKSTIVREISQALPGKVIVVAPTGLAAANVDGTTIHRLLGFGPYPISYRHPRQIRLLKPDRRRVLRRAEIIIVDEASMLRADLMDALDWGLRKNLGKETKPFGGKKVLLVGDLLQLDPVVGDDEKSVLSEWDGHMFFDGKVWQEARLRAIRLETVHRQADDLEFAAALADSRRPERLPFAVDWLDDHLGISGESGEKVVIATTNAIADEINAAHLKELMGRYPPYEGIVPEGQKFAESEMRAPKRLYLKPGARVLIVANDRNEPRRYVNGTLAKVTRLFKSRVEVLTDEGRTIILDPYTWDRYEPQVSEQTGLLEQCPVASYTQIPLRLAWAFTVHKSQGLSFSEVHLIPGQRFFASGHAYVGLSRCRTIAGQTCQRRITEADFYWNPRLRAFLEKIEANPIWP